MYGGSSSGLDDFLERLPGRPWWWGAGLGLLLVVVLVFSLRNVGQGGVHVPRPGDDFSDQEPTPPKKPGAVNTGKPRPPARTADDAAGANEAEHHAAKKPPRAAPAAPAVLGQWNDGDFLRAREAGRSPPGRGAGRAGKESAADPGGGGNARVAAEAGGPARRSGKRGDAAADPPAAPKGVFHAVAAALGANQTAAARQTLAGLLAGDFPEAPAEAVAEDAAVALLRQGSAQSEQIVLDHLVAAPSADRQRRGRGRRERLRLGAAAEALGAGSHRRPPPPADHRQVLLALLCEPNPRNLEAQVLLYQSASADAADAHGVGEAVCRGQHGGAAGVAGPGRRAGGGRPPPPSACYRLAGQLWGPPLTDFLDVQHRALGAMAERPAAIVLALTVPNQALRIRLRRTLSRHWSEGPQALRAAGVPGAVLVEPGLPAVLKSLLRESQRARIAAYKAAARSGYGHGGGRPNGPRPRLGEPPKTPPIATGTS